MRRRAPRVRARVSSSPGPISVPGLGCAETLHFVRASGAGTALLVALALSAGPASAQRSRFGDIPDEPVERTLDHYPESNEHRHDLWFSAVAGRGGAFLGVGSDQCYSIAAAQGAELVFLVDYDPLVTRLHRALASLIRECPDAACLRARLEPSAEAASAAHITAALGDGWESERTARAFLVHRPLLRAHLAGLSAVPSWVSRADWYAHLHRLAREDRLVARTADLRGPSTLRAVGRAARREGVRFEVLYLSNAEEYFDYEPRFVANLEALPASDRALVLRTLRDRRLARPHGDRAWHYGVEPLADLLRRIRDLGYADSSYLVRDLVDSGAGDSELSVLDERVPARARPGPRRWWLEASAPRRAHDGPRRESRVLLAARRALRPAGAVDLAGTGLAHAGPAALGLDPRTSAPLVLSGEPSPPAIARAEVPEDALYALLLDVAARELLPPVLSGAELEEEAASLERAPAAADLYAAYRLRERLLEVCPADRRAAGRAAAALRACRAVIELVRPVPTRRAQPAWPERERRITRALSAIARAGDELALDPAARTAALARLAAIARGMRPLDAGAATAPRDP